jgi:hypothetical protein
MKRANQAIAVGVPAIGLCVLTFALIIRSYLPLGGGLNEVVFYLQAIELFSIPMSAWLPVAFISHGLGYLLFRRCQKKSLGLGHLVLAEGIMCVPLFVSILLFTVAEYVGP